MLCLWLSGRFWRQWSRWNRNRHHIFLKMEIKTYAIINEEHGWLENLVRWDGDISQWQPPSGTVAKPFEELDLASLPQRPEE